MSFMYGNGIFNILNITLSIKKNLLMTAKVAAMPCLFLKILSTLADRII